MLFPYKRNVFVCWDSKCSKYGTTCKCCDMWVWTLERCELFVGWFCFSIHVNSKDECAHDRYLNFLLGSLSLAHGREANGNCHYLWVTTVTLFRLSCLFVCSAECSAGKMSVKDLASVRKMWNWVWECQVILTKQWGTLMHGWYN